MDNINELNKNNMSEIKIINKVVEETVETTIDNIEENLVEYMYEYGNYEESDDIFYSVKQEMFKKVIEELYNRINNNK